VIVYLQYRSQFFALRYILYALPIYLLLSAAGVWSLVDWIIRNTTQARVGGALFAAATALLIVFQLQRVVFDYHVPKDDWRRLGEFLMLNTRPGDTLGAPDVQAFIRFYAPNQKAALVDANDLGPHQQALANGERFWFVDSTYTLLPVGETQQWARSL